MSKSRSEYRKPGPAPSNASSALHIQNQKAKKILFTYSLRKKRKKPLLHFCVIVCRGKKVGKMKGLIDTIWNSFDGIGNGRKNLYKVNMLAFLVSYIWQFYFHSSNPFWKVRTSEKIKSDVFCFTRRYRKVPGIPLNGNAHAIEGHFSKICRVSMPSGVELFTFVFHFFCDYVLVWTS